MLQPPGTAVAARYPALGDGLCGRLRPTPRRRGAAPTIPVGAGALPPAPLAVIMLGSEWMIIFMPIRTSHSPAFD
jgi:hypothetical protein